MQEKKYFWLIIMVYTAKTYAFMIVLAEFKLNISQNSSKIPCFGWIDMESQPKL